MRYLNSITSLIKDKNRLKGAVKRICDIMNMYIAFGKEPI